MIYYIQREIEVLGEMAASNRRTGFIELAEKQEQYISWLKELLMYRTWMQDMM